MKIPSWLKNEPVTAYVGVAAAGIGVLQSFDIGVTAIQKSAIEAAIVAVAGLFARQAVTPGTKARMVKVVDRKEHFAELRASRIDLLPKPSGRKHGALPSPRDERDYKAALPKAIPSAIDYGAGMKFGMLLNDRISDCYPAALLHAIQVLSGAVYLPSDADVLKVYEQVTGYDPTKTDAQGDNPTDQGTAGRPLFKWAKSKGLILTYAAVPTDRDSVRAAIAKYHVVLCEWALPEGAETEGDHWTVPRKGKTAGSWGGHATAEAGFTARSNKNITWGEVGTVTPTFEDAYLDAAWVITVPAVIPAIH